MELDREWMEAVGRAARHRRVVVLGATDMGKSTFIRALLDEAPGTMLIDLDPGQKMIGPPGTATLGRLDPAELDRFVFIGGTSSSSIGAIARAAAGLAEAASRQAPFVANTSGFVKGLGARLQAATVAALRPDLIVQIGADAEAPIVRPAEGISTISLARSAAARRKSASARAHLRQQAFSDALWGAELQALPSGIIAEPGPPAPFTGAARPVCSLADEAGTDLAYGILQGMDADRFQMLTSGPASAACRLRLGRMWAEPKDGAWRLLEKLEPAWASENAA